MRPVSGDFGVELARLRGRRGWSVREFARRASLSDGQVCNLESGRRNPTPPMAAACDAACDADGMLIELAEAARRRASVRPEVDGGALAAGYGRILEELKSLGRSTGPQSVTAPLRAVMRTLADAGEHAARDQRAGLWLLASSCAEYAGWMAQEAGDVAEALHCTDLAVRWGTDHGDETVAAYALVRRASIAEYRGDADAALRFARRAGRHPASTPLIRAHAARREAQACALLGDDRACREALDESIGHAADDHGDGPPRWGPRIENGNPRLIEASCLLTLERYEQAAELFGAELERRPAAPPDNNSRTRFAIRRATALIGVGCPDEADGIIQAILPTVRRLDSATVHAELRRAVDLARARGVLSGRRGLLAASVASGWPALNRNR